MNKFHPVIFYLSVMAAIMVSVFLLLLASDSGQAASTIVYPPISIAGSPHGGYGTANAPMGARTDLCLSCHDIHQAQGDYALMREATVTNTCATCHAMFGRIADNTWTEAPTQLPDGGAIAAVSQSAVYENIGADRKSGHRLGISLDPGTPNLASDLIPGSDTDLDKDTDDPQMLTYMSSSDYGDGNLYDGGSVLAKTALNGLSCASCHTPHSSVGGVDTDGNGMANEPIPVNDYDAAGNPVSQAFFGDQLVIDDCAGLPLDSQACIDRRPQHVKAEKLISSNPNHISDRALMNEDANNNGILDAGEDTLIANGMLDSFMTPVAKPASYNDWCLTCHNRQWNGTDWGGTQLHGTPGVNNHPPLCVSCHSSQGGDKGLKDFPHTSGNEKLLARDNDGMCLACHDMAQIP